MNGRRRVVVTGLGMVTPLGNDVDTTWRRLLAGESGAGPITQFDPKDYFVKFACEVKDFDPTDYIERKQARRMDRFTHLILGAARQAEQDSGLDIAAEAERVGAAIATGIGGLKSFQDCTDTLRERGPDRVNPFSIPAIIPNIGAGWVSMELGTKGPLSSQCTACAASNMAIGESADAIRLGRADVMFAGGTEAPITHVGIAGFGSMRALSRRNDDPEAASRPFDQARDGFVMGEGGGALILEALEHAEARGATPLAELVGYGATADASHITLPAPGGIGAVRAAQRALEKAGMEPAEIDHVNAHATSTPEGDKAELQSIHTIFGDHAPRVAITANKSMLGHTLGAAGAIEAIATIMAIREGCIPPTINLDDPDEQAEGLDLTPNVATQRTVRAAMSNSFGFGGQNTALVFRRWDG